MLTRREVPALRVSRSSALLLFAALLFSCGCVFVLGGCASPGEPTERKAPVPEAVGDLAAQQVGNGAALTFTVPDQTADKHPLNQPQGVEIYRDFAPAATSNPQAPTTLLVTIPAAMVSNYVTQGRFHYTDELRPEDFTGHPNSAAVYAVRTRASAKNSSGASNVASVRVYPLPDAIADLKTEVTHTGIQLTWTPPTRTPVGAAPPIASYRIYRALAPAAVATQQPANAQGAATAANPSQALAQSPAQTPPLTASLTKIAETQSPDYLDTQIQFGNSYIYLVRSVATVEGEPRESGDSNRVTILARDTFPPATPQGLIVVFVPGQGTEPGQLELSWNISPETDLAGYNVYRTEQSGVQGTHLNSELLPTPAFRDMNAVPGRTYFYSVTAVDRSGNESAASEPASGEVPTEAPPAR
jgi:hypothetical protein